MKVDKDVREQLVKNLEDWLDGLHRVMKYQIEKINEAETVEDIMRYKKDMLAHYVKYIPVGIDQCYFCLLHWLDDCEPCQYGVIHGVCDSAGSDYREIDMLWNKLIRAIEEKYYKGESYDMEGVILICGGE